MSRRTIPFVVMLLVGCALSECGRRTEIPSGLYVPQSPAMGVDRVFVDREHQVVWIAFQDAALRVVPYTACPRDEWPSGCPGNAGSTRMEVLEVSIEELEIGSVIVRRPILVRDCPPDPVELVLRDDGAIGGAGTACSGAPTCIVLEPVSDTMSLPQLLKGYELYSWYGAGDETWRYTLITGTNRPKTWQEISAAGSTITEDGWVKITVDGAPALKSLLGRLPRGVDVFWIGPDDPQAASTLGDHLQLPNGDLVREIRRYGRQLGLGLSAGG